MLTAIACVTRILKFYHSHYKFDAWLTVHLSSMWNKKPTRCHLVLYLFLLISCSTCFGPPCAHLQELTTWWYFFTCGVVPWLCRIWLPTQPRHYTTREKIPLSRQLQKMGTRWRETCWATYKEQFIRRNKYNTKWHLVGFLFHIVTIFESTNTLICSTWNFAYIYLGICLWSLYTYTHTRTYVRTYTHRYIRTWVCKIGKPIQLQVWTGPNLCGKLRLPDFKKSGIWML